MNDIVLFSMFFNSELVAGNKSYNAFDSWGSYNGHVLMSTLVFS